ENHRPTTKMILSHDTVLMYLRLSEDQQKLKQEKIKALAERDGETLEKERAQFELNRERSEKDQQKRRADSAQVELNRANTQIDQENQRANNAEELTRIFQQQVETTQSEVTRLSSEVRRLNQELSRRETDPSTPKAQLIQTPVPNTKPKQALIQVTSSAQAISVNLEVPSGMNGHKEQNRFNHDNTEAFCTISTDPIISEGIVYYESVFENHDGNVFGIGIADHSVAFKPNKWPSEDGNKGKTVNYQNYGELFHISWGPDNQGFRSGQIIGLEVNMISRPRRLTFFVDDIEQKYYVVNIPEAIRFWSLIYEPNSSFTVTRFERRSSSSAHGVTGSRSLEWGKYW
ncbi:MAG: hypothetical protein EZS28_040519, partial [Streblomastix strix]